MLIPENNVAMKEAATIYLMTKGSALPEETRTALIAASTEPNWADGHAKMLEALWPIRDQLDDAGKTVIGQIAGFLGSWSLLGMNDDSRARRIMFAMQRDLGEDAPAGITWPEPDTDPAYATPLAEARAAAAPTEMAEDQGA